MKKTTQKKKTKTKGRTDKRLNHPKFAAKEITAENLELFLSVFSEPHRLFTLEYTRTWNARSAYQKIYPEASERTGKANGHKLLKDAKVQMYLDWLAYCANEKFEVTKEGLMKDLDKVKKWCMKAEPVRDSDGDPTGEYKFNAAGANKAIELSGKELGMFTNRVEVTDDGKSLNYILHYHVVPEIKTIDMATKEFEDDITDAVEKYIKERSKKK